MLIVKIAVLLLVLGLPAYLILHLRKKRKATQAHEEQGASFLDKIKVSKSQWGKISIVGVSLLACSLLFLLYPDLYDWGVANFKPWGIILGFLLLVTFGVPLANYLKGKDIAKYFFRTGLCFVIWMFAIWVTTSVSFLGGSSQAGTLGGVKGNDKHAHFVPRVTSKYVVPSRVGNNYEVSIPLGYESVRLGIQLKPGETVVVHKVVPVGVKIPPVRLFGGSGIQHLGIGPFGAYENARPDGYDYVPVSRLREYREWTKYRRADGPLYVNDDYIIAAPMFIINGHPQMYPLGCAFETADSAQELLACCNLKRSGGQVNVSGSYKVTFSIVTT